MDVQETIEADCSLVVLVVYLLYAFEQLNPILDCLNSLTPIRVQRRVRDRVLKWTSENEREDPYP